MYQHSTSNFDYFPYKETKGRNLKTEISEKKLQKILQILAKQALKEKRPSVQDLERILQDAMIQLDVEKKPEHYSEGMNETYEMGDEPITKYLREKGYICDGNKWLTKKGFFEIGGKILRDVMKILDKGDFGYHETKNVGSGSLTLDTTRRFEPGNEIKFLSVPHTILNAIQRISKQNLKIQFPLSMEIDDLEEFETADDVKATVVYCIDLSSTMKYSVGKKGVSRIEAAKKALWSLYVLNKKFFPNDSIYIVGFGSLASEIAPQDIPYLSTYDANDNFLHYTNYQAAFRLARKILRRNNSQNKRIVMITDGQPSACFIDNESQKNNILSDKPYSNFYIPDSVTLSKLKDEKNIKLDTSDGSMVYLCYRYRKVDPKIDNRTLTEAKKCSREGIKVDTIVIGEESELLHYVEGLEKQLKGIAYYINQENMDTVLVNDYLTNNKRVFRRQSSW